ncbi:MAG TPA: ABC transporter ATP-binding protein [Candidatus Kryptonia bacterium]
MRIPKEFAIELSRVSWRVNGASILYDINWKVNRGEHWAVIGLNGSGKTTLLNMINGYIYPSSGEVRVLGRKFGSSDLREMRKSIGWVSSSLQENLYENDSVEEIVLSGKFASIGLYDQPAKSDLAMAGDLLEMFRCVELQKRKYLTLSQGEKQKVLLARAMMSSPSLLILDEPCTGLDFIARENFLSTVESMAIGQADVTLIYVSHHIEEILPVFRHSLLLRDGRVHSAGVSESVITGSNLSEFYGMAVSVKRANGRYFVNTVNSTRRSDNPAPPTDRLPG